MDDLKRKFNVQIFGTDIDKEAINTARAGIYPENISADISQERLMRFFVKEANTCHICQEIREMAIFSIQNIVKDPPFTRLDLICCRNFLIYLDAELQKKLLPIFHYALKPCGILFLGSSETITGFGDLFSVELDHTREYLENIINTVRESLIVLDKDPRIISCNRSFYITFQVLL